MLPREVRTNQVATRLGDTSSPYSHRTPPALNKHTVKLNVGSNDALKPRKEYSGTRCHATQNRVDDDLTTTCGATKVGTTLHTPAKAAPQCMASYEHARGAMQPDLDPRAAGQ